MLCSSDAIRILLVNAFSDEEFSIFCYDHFREVYDNFADGQTKQKKIQLLIEHIERHNQTGTLLDLIKKHNPDMYAEHESGLIDKTQSEKFKININNMPSTSPDLFGREHEIEMLDRAWEDTKTNIVTLIAFAGVGKTALVKYWLNLMAQNKFKGAERVFGWSFYSQGASEDRQASADQFIAKALEWFGDPDPKKGSPGDKGERLAELIKKKKTLLILDGLEPLQYPTGEMKGHIKDADLQRLLGSLVYDNPGLCIITSRLRIDNIKDCVGTLVNEIMLDRLSTEAGVQLLRNLDVTGLNDELGQAVDEFKGHALAITLLGTYLKKVYHGDILQRDRIIKLVDERREDDDTKHARNMMDLYEEWFEGKPELNILYIMGLFDKPAEGGAIEAVRKEPVIDGLTNQLKGLSHADWMFAIANLRTA
ncbi:MAG: NACHT domain-containing protein, partial [Candidatus Poribacteria bacterium]